MNNTMSRREALRNLGIAAGALAMARSAAADSLPHLSPADPVAASLGYQEHAGAVDAAKFPQFKAGAKCSNCSQVTGKAGDAWRPCNLFAGKLVSADGWCSVYAKKV